MLLFPLLSDLSMSKCSFIHSGFYLLVQVQLKMLRFFTARVQNTEQG